jgi:acetyl esterase/lipase
MSNSRNRVACSGRSAFRSMKNVWMKFAMICAVLSLSVSVGYAKDQQKSVSPRAQTATVKEQANSNPNGAHATSTKGVPSAKVETAAATPARAVKSEWFSLTGEAMVAPYDLTSGRVSKFETAALCVTHSQQPESKGTVLLFPGGGYKILDVNNEGARTANQLNAFGYDVAMLIYHINSGAQTRDLALADAQAAWRLLKTKPQALGVDPRRSLVMGYSAGGHLAARLAQSLTAETDKQPDDVILVYPAYLEERAAEATGPTVVPPTHPTSRLVVMMGTKDRKQWVEGAQSYVEAWKKAGGSAVFHALNNTGHGFGMGPNMKGDAAKWPELLEKQLSTSGSKADQ